MISNRKVVKEDINSPKIADRIDGFYIIEFQAYSIDTLGTYHLICHETEINIKYDINNDLHIWLKER